MIKLTFSSNDLKFWLNVSHIEHFFLAGKSKTMQETNIAMNNGNVYCVNETPEQILQKIQDIGVV